MTCLEGKENFILDLDQLRSKITPKTRLLVLNDLENPTGAEASHEELEQVAALAGGAAVVPLLARAPRLWLRPSWHALRFDPAGFPRLDDLWCVR